MRKGGGHSKGANFERTVAKLIVQAFRKFGIVQRDCWRSVLSGGHVMSSGDLVLSEKLRKLFPFAVECKFHKQILWWHFLVAQECRQKSWQEWQWVDQCKEGAESHPELELLPLLVMKENHGPILVGGWGISRNTNSGAFRLMTLSDFLKKKVREAESRRK